MSVPAWVGTVAQRYAQCFPKTPAWRTIGREAEFPVVRSDNGDWADVHWLLQTILEQGSDTMKAEKEQGPKRRSFRQERLVKVTDESTGTQWTAEVGGGTVEVITGALSESARAQGKARERCTDSFASSAFNGPIAARTGYWHAAFFASNKGVGD